MKRTMIILLSLTILLSGCHAEDRDNVFELEPTIPVESQAESNTQPTEPAQLPKPEAGYYQYGNMQTGDPAGNFVLFEGSVLFTDISPLGQHRLYAYNLSDGSVSFLCKDASCTHGANCPSGMILGNLEQYRGHLYAMDHNYRVVEWKNGAFEPVVDGRVNAFWHSENRLFVITGDHSLLSYENDAGKPETVSEEYTERWNTAFGSRVYSGFGFGTGLCCIDISGEDALEILIPNAQGKTDGKSFYYTDYETDYLYRCAMDGSSPELLVPHPVLPGSLNFDEDFLYFRQYRTLSALYGEGSDILYRLSKSESSQPEPVAVLPEPIEEVYTIPGYDLLFVCTIELGELVDGYYPDAQRHIFTVSTTDGSLTRLELPHI